MTSPRVAVVIPTYNHARFLPAALDSVRAQTLADWEAIVVNNHSTDDTEAIVASYGDPRIRLVNFSNHGVIAASRNHGLSLTEAPLVAFLDSDDLWYADKLDRCVGLIDSGHDVVCHAETWVGPGERRRDVVYGPQARASYDSLLFDGNCLSTSAVVARRDWVVRAGGFSERADFITAEDYDLWLNLARAGARIGFVDTVLGEYLIHEGNQSRSALRNMEAVSAVFEAHLETLGLDPRSARIRRRRAIIRYGGARGLQDSGQFAQARGLFLQALRLYPWEARFHAALILNTLHRTP